MRHTIQTLAYKENHPYKFTLLRIGATILVITIYYLLHGLRILLGTTLTIVGGIPPRPPGVAVNASMLMV